MMKNILLALLVIVTFFSCKNAYEKEHQQITDLQTAINEAEVTLFSVDTAEVFTLVREIKLELWAFGNKYDSLDKESAFKVADYYRNKKNLYFFYDNYSKFNKEIQVSREQLAALQKDLDNGVITQEKFLEYYDNEQQIILALNDKINKAVKGIGISVGRIKKSKAEIKELLKGYEIKEQEE